MCPWGKIRHEPINWAQLVVAMVQGEENILVRFFGFAIDLARVPPTLSLTVSSATSSNHSRAEFAARQQTFG